MELYLSGTVFVFGLLVGSFLNVLILRHGFGEQRRSRSGCSSCGATLLWYELLPVVSYVMLRGRCRECGSKVLLQYPLVEVVTGFLFLATFITTYPFLSVAPFALFLASLLFWASFVVLAVYDMRHTLIPLPFAGALIASALLIRASEAWLFSSMFPLLDALFGALIFGGFLFLLYALTRGKGMGFGDVYVGVALGIVFGFPASIEVITISFWVGAVVGIALLALKTRFTMKSEVPFVPFLFIGAVIGAFTSFSPLLFVATLL